MVRCVGGGASYRGFWNPALPACSFGIAIHVSRDGESVLNSTHLVPHRHLPSIPSIPSRQSSRTLQRTSHITTTITTSRPAASPSASPPRNPLPQRTTDIPTTPTTPCRHPASRPNRQRVASQRPDQPLPSATSAARGCVKRPWRGRAWRSLAGYSVQLYYCREGRETGEVEEIWLPPSCLGGTEVWILDGRKEGWA